MIYKYRLGVHCSSKENETHQSSKMATAFPAYIWVFFGFGTVTSFVLILKVMWRLYLTTKDLKIIVRKSMLQIFTLLFHLTRALNILLVAFLPDQIARSEMLNAAFTTATNQFIHSQLVIIAFTSYNSIVFVSSRNAKKFPNTVYWVLAINSVLGWLVFGANAILFNGERPWHYYYGIAFISAFILVGTPVFGKGFPWIIDEFN